MALANHSAVALPDGKVLVVGGDSWSGGARSASCLLDPSSGSARATGGMRECRTNQPGLIVLPQGRVLVAGGRGRDGRAPASCELYDPEEGTWSITGALAHSRSRGTCLLLKTGKVLAIGGDNETGALSACELYDPESGTWIPTAALTTGWSGVCFVFLADGRILAAGGYDVPGQHSGCELYDPTTGVWTRTGSLLTGRYYASAATLENGSVLVVGGTDTRNRLLASCELYDPATGSWHAAAPVPLTRSATFPLASQLATRLPDGTVLVAGGITGENLRHYQLPATCYRYDPGTDTRNQAPDLRTPRSSHQALLLESGKLLLIGGATGRGLTDSLEVYDPGQ